MSASVLFLLGLGLVASWLCTAAVRRYALARSVLDIPNGRSSHSVPTPRGGGLAIAVIVLAGLAAVAALGAVPGPAAGALAAAAAVALIGWIDDHRTVPPATRAVVQTLAAAWALFWLGGLPTLHLGAGVLPLGMLGAILGVVGIVWLTNLYNFMDGVDGIAGVEAVSVGAIGGLFLHMSGEQGLALLAWLIAASSAGFLLWNWMPAKIFMGDIGSGMLGFLFAVLAIASERLDAVPVLVWVLLLGVFVFDATVTLLRRVFRGERWYTPHRMHAYQRAVQAGWSHAQVSSTVLALNGVLGLLAWFAWSHPSMMLPAIVLGMLLLAVVYWRVEQIQPMPPAAEEDR